MDRGMSDDKNHSVIKKYRVLLIVESCNPELSSVPLVGYNFFKSIAQFADVHLVTHCRNRPALNRIGVVNNVTYYEQTRLEKIYYRLIRRLSTFRGQAIWPIRHALQFPIYFFFDRFVSKAFSQSVRSGEYNLVHAMTPIMPRYPYKILRSCKIGEHKTPFILGPVNGGVPFPEAFKNIGRKEFSYLNWLRRLGHWMIPGYRYTYLQADIILAGSSYTDGWLKKTFPGSADRMQIMYENGVSNCFYQNPEHSKTMSNYKTTTGSSDFNDRRKYGNELRLLFLGRLEPYKGCDMLVEAIAGLTASERKKIKLSIVGDGSQRTDLEVFVKSASLSDTVEFRGWIAHAKVSYEYAVSDLFCFPSVREFGGAVVMEAMASGLPCIVVDNGGIGEYVTEYSGVKIRPLGRDYVVEKLREHILALASNRTLLEKLSLCARDRAKLFSWEHKSRELEDVYERARTICDGPRMDFPEPTC